MRPSRAIAALALLAALCLAQAPSAEAASKAPLFVYTPQPGTGARPPFEPPPTGWLEGPCGLAVDAGGSFYVSDYYHDAIDVFDPPESPFQSPPEYLGQQSVKGACALAIDSAGQLYANELHGRVRSLAAGVIDPDPATGVAIDPATDNVYVDDRNHISVYKPSGEPVEVVGEPLQIGVGSLQDGYGIAVSGYPATEGFLYVPDAATDTVKVYDPATDTAAPVEVIAAAGGPFSSLRDSAIAVDDTSGEVYVADDLQPEVSDRPEAAIYVFDYTGGYQGRLKYNIVDSRPPGLAVDNSGGMGGKNEGEQGRVYVTSGNTEKASVIAYGPSSAGPEARSALESPEPLPPGGCACGVLPEPPPPVTCEGDSCQHLPSEPTDPTLNTLIEGAANPPVRFHDTNRLAHYRRLRHHHHAGRKAKHRKGDRR